MTAKFSSKTLIVFQIAGFSSEVKAVNSMQLLNMNLINQIEKLFKQMQHLYNRKHPPIQSNSYKLLIWLRG
jgi:hypothetical protein